MLITNSLADINRIWERGSFG